MTGTKERVSHGAFWPLGTAEGRIEAERVPGTLTRSSEGVELKLESNRLNAIMFTLPDEAERYKKCIVGALGPSSYVRLERLHRQGWGVHTMRSEATHRFRLLGDMIESPDERILFDDHVTLTELHVEMDRLSEWFTTMLQTPDQFEGELIFSYQVNPPSEARFCSNDDPAVDLDVGAGLHLSIGNRLYTQPQSRFECLVQHATVATFVAKSGTAPLSTFLERVGRLRALIEFLAGEECAIRYCLGRNLNKNLETEGKEKAEYPAPYAIRTGYVKKEEDHRLEEMILYWRDLAGTCEQVVANWFKMYPEIRAATRMVARSTPGREDSESAEAGIILMAGAVQALMRGSCVKEPRMYQSFLEDMGMAEWGIDTAAWGKRIAQTRNQPAHGSEWDQPSEVGAVYRLLIAALQLGILKRVGLSSDQLRRLAVRHQGIRRALGFEMLPTSQYSESYKPGWIISGGAV